MLNEGPKTEVFKLVYPSGSYDAQLPERMVFQPDGGDGWSLEDAEEFAQNISNQFGVHKSEISLVNSYGKEISLFSHEERSNS